MRQRGFIFPPFLIQPALILGGIAIALLVLWWFKHDYDEKLKEEGRHEIEVRAAKETFRQQEAWTRRVQESETSATKVEEKHREQFKPIFKRAEDIERSLPPNAAARAAERTAAFDRLFLDARDSAEAARSTPLPREATPAPASSTDALVIQLYDWSRTAIERDEEWRNFYEALKRDQKVQQKDNDGKGTGVFSVAP